jgi:lysozyme
MFRKRRRWPVLIAAFAGCIAALVAYAWLVGGGPEPDERAPIALPVCRDGPTTPGIDVSYYQDRIRWRRVRRAGVLFAFIRVSDSTTLPDPRFAENWDGARKAGIARGAYQYFRPDQDPIAQADLLIAAVRRDRGELPPVIDVETTGGKSARHIERAVRAWIDRVRTQLEIEPIVYTGPAFWRDDVDGADLTSQPLWIAHYTQGCPSVPSPWPQWTFWQYTDRGTISGIPRPVDLNVFAGSFAELEDFMRRSRVPPRSARR